VRFEVFAAVTMKNAVFWNVTPRGSCNNRRFGGTSALGIVTWRSIPEDGSNAVHFQLTISYKLNITLLATCFDCNFLFRLFFDPEVGGYMLLNFCSIQGTVSFQCLLSIVVLKNAFFWDVTPCNSCKNRRFGERRYVLRNVGSYKIHTA
jgi:hypothetical protein